MKEPHLLSECWLSTCTQLWLWYNVIMLLCSVYISTAVFVLRPSRVTTAALTAPSLSVGYQACMHRAKLHPALGSLLSAHFSGEELLTWASQQRLVFLTCHGGVFEMSNKKCNGRFFFFLYLSILGAFVCLHSSPKGLCSLRFWKHSGILSFFPKTRLQGLASQALLTSVVEVAVGQMGASWTQSFRREFQVKKLHLSPPTPELLLEPRVSTSGEQQATGPLLA